MSIYGPWDTKLWLSHKTRLHVRIGRKNKVSCLYMCDIPLASFKYTFAYKLKCPVISSMFTCLF